jgi:hypothetical protein
VVVSLDCEAPINDTRELEYTVMEISVIVLCIFMRCLEKIETYLLVFLVNLKLSLYAL